MSDSRPEPVKGRLPFGGLMVVVACGGTVDPCGCTREVVVVVDPSGCTGGDVEVVVSPVVVVVLCSVVVVLLDAVLVAVAMVVVVFGDDVVVSPGMLVEVVDVLSTDVDVSLPIVVVVCSGALVVDVDEHFDSS